MYSVVLALGELCCVSRLLFASSGHDGRITDLERRARRLCCSAFGCLAMCGRISPGMWADLARTDRGTGTNQPLRMYSTCTRYIPGIFFVLVSVFTFFYLPFFFLPCWFVLFFYRVCLPCVFTVRIYRVHLPFVIVFLSGVVRLRLCSLDCFALSRLLPYLILPTTIINIFGLCLVGPQQLLLRTKYLYMLRETSADLCSLFTEEYCFWSQLSHGSFV